MTSKREELPDEVKASLEEWGGDNPEIDLEQPAVAKTLRVLAKKKLDAKNLLLVLELLRVYSSPELLEDSKRRFRNWIKRGESLAMRLRRDAKDFLQLFPGEMLDRGFVKMLLKRAERLERLMIIRTFMAQELDFGREVVGSTSEPTAGAVFLVMASELITRRRGSPSWPLARMLACHLGVRRW